LAVVLPTVPALAQEAGDDGALKRFFQTTQHLQADFTQLEYDGDGIFQKESTGRLYLSRPGRFRLDYLEPDELMIWADGENLSMFDKELEQVTVYKQTEQLRESAAALLAGDAVSTHDAFGPPPIPNFVNTSNEDFLNSCTKVEQIASELDAFIFPGHDESGMQYSQGELAIKPVEFMPGHTYE